MDSDSSEEEIEIEFPLEESCNTKPGVLALKLCNERAKGLNNTEFIAEYCCNYESACINGTVVHETEDKITFDKVCSGALSAAVDRIALLVVVAVAALFASH